ncbi:MAG: tol-pal system protein YbgF, partial [Smithellaceae bacterium]|nr:tol-pal system protein YbgF [Smithellaceae bacterium]
MRGVSIRNTFFAFLCAGLLFISGCATRSDYSMLQKDSLKPTDVQSAQENKIQGLAEDVSSLKQDLGKNSETIGDLRKVQADMGASLTDLRDQLHQIRGSMEVLRKEIPAATVRSSRREEEIKELRDRLENVSFKISFIENFIGVGKKPETAEPAEKGKTPTVTTGKDTPPKGGRTDKESAYAAAFEIFKEGKYERARLDFQNFLKQFPDSEYSDNAQFWIAESFYFENRFDKAIPEYEKVIKNYPEGNKVSHALLKLGISYANIGDRVKARATLQQVIKDFPNTS